MELDSLALVGRRPRTPKKFEAGFQTQGDGRLQGPSFGTERCIALEAAADGGQVGLEHRGIYRLHPLRAAEDRSEIQPEGQWPPTPLTDSMDSSSISWSHNNLGRRFLEV